MLLQGQKFQYVTVREREGCADSESGSGHGVPGVYSRLGVAAGVMRAWLEPAANH